MPNVFPDDILKRLRTLETRVATSSSSSGGGGTSTASSSWTVQSVTTTYTAAVGEFVLADASGGAFTVTLPTPTSLQSGQRVAVKRINAGSEGKNVTVSGTIDGGSSVVLRSLDDTLTAVSDGTVWRRDTWTSHIVPVANVLAPEFGANNADVGTSGAAIQAALDSFPTAGTRIGGTVVCPAGDYYIERPLIVPHLVRLIGSNAQGGTILRAHSTFPTMTMNNGGTLTLPANNTAFTFPVTTMSVNMPTAGGVFTVLTSVGFASVVYTGISSNTFTGCKLKNTGASTYAGATIADGAVVGTFMVWLGDPANATGGTYGNRVENIGLDGSTTGASSGAIAGISGLFSNRCQEDAGWHSFKARNYLHFGVHMGQAPQAQFQQDWMGRGVTLSPASTCTADTVSLQIDGAATTLRGFDDCTFASVGLVDTPATAMKISGCTGHMSRILVERHAIALHLVGSGSANGNSGLVVSALHGYGGGGGDTNMTDVVKVDSSHTGSFALFGIRQISATSCNLINHNDGNRQITLTDASVGMYVCGEENAQGTRAIITDSPNLPADYQFGGNPITEDSLDLKSLSIIGNDPDRVNLSVTPDASSEVSMVEFGLTNIAADTFTRTASSLGTADTGGAWTAIAGSSWSTNGTTAYFNATSSQDAIATLNVGLADVTVEADVIFSSTRANAGLALRVTDANNYLRVALNRNGTNSQNHISLTKTVSGVATNLVDNIGNYLTLGHTYHVKAVLTGKRIRVFVRDTTAGETADTLWIDHTMTGGDATTLRTPTKHGIVIVINSGTINDLGGTSGSHFDNFLVGRPSFSVDAAGIAHGDIAFTPTGTISSTTVAAAIAEVASEAVADMSFYRTALTATGHATTAATSTPKYMCVAGNDDVSAPTSGGSATRAPFFFPLVAADLDVTGDTTKLRVSAQVLTGTAPAVTITVGLYPVTAGATLGLGTVVAGSTVAFTTPAANSITTGNSGDFTLPADGNYAPGYILSGTPSADFTVETQVQVRNV